MDPKKWLLDESHDRNPVKKNSTKTINNNDINTDNIIIQNNINGADYIIPQRQLRKRTVPKTQKYQLNTTVYKIFEDKIHQGSLSKFDPKEGFHTIQYKDGDEEEGDEIDIARLLKPPNKTTQ